MSRVAKILAGVIVIFVIVVYCATQSAQAYAVTLTEQQVKQIELIHRHSDMNDWVSGKSGLTPIGYQLFFPGRNVKEGLKLWKRMNPFQRLAYVERYGSLLARGSWVDARNRWIALGLKVEVPEISGEEINGRIENLGVQAVKNCIGAGIFHADFCLFGYGRIARFDEMRQAELWLKYYELYAGHGSGSQGQTMAGRLP